MNIVSPEKNLENIDANSIQIVVLIYFFALYFFNCMVSFVFFKILVFF